MPPVKRGNAMATMKRRLISETGYVNPQQEAQLFGNQQDTQALLLPYRYAVDYILKLLEGVKSEYSRSGIKNPIRNVDSRIKSPDSIAKKIDRRNLPPVPESLGELQDVAGVRVICHHVNDVYWIADYLLASEEVSLLRESDYIESPKSNGYRSLHLILEANICVFGDYKTVPVEVQIRTTAMDFWAGIEHQIRYKSQRDIPESVKEQLRECAQVINDVDIRMQEISRSLMEDEDNYDYFDEDKNYSW